MRRAFLLSCLALLAPLASSQTTVVFDEDDGGDAAVYEASEGAASGGDTVELVAGRMPLTSEAALSGSVSGEIAYTHGDGAWSLVVGAPGFAPLDLSGIDSLTMRLNAPAGIPGVVLPSVELVDADGRRSAALPLDFGTLVGFARARSGFTDASSTDARVSVRYQSSIPEDRARPGYPETLVLTFADTPQTTSRPAIGLPATDANFTVETDGGEALEFQFRDTDGDGTLSAAGDYIVVLTPEADGSTRLLPTWRIELAAASSDPPGAGDVYRLVVFNGGVDSDPETWQRRAFSLADFGPLDGLDLSRVRGVRFSNPDNATGTRTLWLDRLVAVQDASSPDGPTPPTELTAEGSDETIALRWTPSDDANGVVVFRQREGEAFTLLTDRPVREDLFFDLTAEGGVAYTYVLRSVSGIQNLQGADSAPVSGSTDAGQPDAYIEETARRAFDYFWREANASNGLVKDRSTPGSASSIAAVGFGLSAYTVGADRGYITREQAVARTLATLEFFATCPQSDAASGTCGYKGFFYHFLNMDTGLRAGTNELSTIDTALLLGGILHAARYYDGAGADETRIRQLADLIWRRVDWTWAAPRSPLVTLGWKPEVGFNVCGGGPCDWRGYNEAMILYVLGLGSPTHPLPDGAWDAWTASYGGDWQTHYGITFLTFPPLFGHQYSHVWIDFRDIQDDYMRGRSDLLGTPYDYFENSRRATLASQAYAVANPGPLPQLLGRGVGPDGVRRPVRLPRARGAPRAERQRDDHADGRRRLLRLHA